MVEFCIKCYEAAWKRKECHMCIFELLRICTREATFDFDVGTGMHQGFALNPFLFTLVMDVLTKGI